MLTGTTSLDLVRDELFASMGEVENLLQQFLEDRQDGSLLQQSIEGLQQLRGTLALIELKGAALLLDEMISLAMDIPVHDGEERNEPLSLHRSASQATARSSWWTCAEITSCGTPSKIVTTTPYHTRRC